MGTKTIFKKGIINLKTQVKLVRKGLMIWTEEDNYYVKKKS